MSLPEYTKCPECGQERGAKTITLVKCGFCGAKLGHLGEGECVVRTGCTAPGRNGHHGDLKSYGIVLKK